MTTINHQLAQLALERVDGVSFEPFAQAFMAAMMGRNFVPLGGQRDGGADGAVDTGLFEGKPSHFMQASVEENYRPRCRTFGLASSPGGHLIVSPIGQSASPASFTCAQANGDADDGYSQHDRGDQVASASHQPVRTSHRTLPRTPSGPVIPIS